MTDAPAPTTASTLSHRLRRMTGRDPRQSHRAATPLELLFDLTFVVAFGFAADQLAHLIAEGDVAGGLMGFGFVVPAVCWAWINYSWFASAYDTDDWFFRILTMVQMVGVLIIALGIPQVFDSLHTGDGLGNQGLVAGYVVMRIAVVVGWLRVAREDPERRRTALTYALVILISQVGWVALLALPNTPMIPVFIVLWFIVDVAGPTIAERKGRIPWHAHHIAERYGLIVIIALGEGLFGTITAVSVLVGEQGWSLETILVVVAGTGLTFSIWWTYFIVPSGDILARHRERGTAWSFLHVLVLGSIVAIGAGLHVTAYVIGGDAHIGAVGAVLSVTIPVLAFILSAVVLYSFLVRDVDWFHLFLLFGTLVVLALAVALASWGVPIGVCLIVVTLAQVVFVVGYEVVGHRHEAELLDRILADE